MSVPYIFRIMVIFLSILGLVSCNTLEPTDGMDGQETKTTLPKAIFSPVSGSLSTRTPEIIIPTNTIVPYTPTASPTKTSSLTPTITSTFTPTATYTSTPSSTATIDNPNNVLRIYLISTSTDGPICGDYAIGIRTLTSISDNVEQDVTNALIQLLGISSVMVGGLYNPLANSDIKLSNVDFDQADGLVTVYLRGEYHKPEDRCDNTRVRAQVWSTVKQFPQVKATNIYLNNMPFGDKLSNVVK